MFIVSFLRGFSKLSSQTQVHKKNKLNNNIILCTVNLASRIFFFCVKKSDKITSCGYNIVHTELLRYYVHINAKMVYSSEVRQATYY